METFNVQPKKSEENLELRVLFGGKIHAQIFGKGNNFSEHRGGSLTGLNSVEDFKLPDRQPVLSFLDDYGDKNKITTFKAPIAWPHHNGRLKLDGENQNNWREKYNFGNGKTMLKGENFEGCEVLSGEAFIMSPADCLTVIIKIVVEGKERFFAMHAGRDSIYDASKKNGEEKQKNIIEKMLESFSTKFPTLKKEDISIWAGFGIGPGEHFLHDENDEKHGKINRDRKEYLDILPVKEKENFTDEHLNLLNVFYNMCKSYGIENIDTDDSFHTYAGEGTDKSKYYSNSAGDKSRNLVIVHFK